jgi:hypothetical protein
MVKAKPPLLPRLRDNTLCRTRPRGTRRKAGNPTARLHLTQGSSAGAMSEAR